MTELPSTSAIADVLALWGLDGWLTPPLLPIVSADQPVMARVLTVEVRVGAEGPGMAPIYDVLSNDLSDTALLIAGAEEAPGAVWGELLSMAAKQQGAQAALVEGWVRDRSEVEAIGLPMYASGERIAGPGGRAHIVAVGGQVNIGGVAVASDDVVVLDAAGCVRIAGERVHEVLDAARRYAAAEQQVAAALAAGEPLTRAYAHKKSMVDELRR
jgi:4-hydroxy-4-methyl-2-oxoglutarate aldolase